MRLMKRRGVYYGWVLVLTLSLTETTSWGILYYAFTVFLTPMQQELGWSRAALTGAFSLALLTSGIVGVPVGRWLDRYGPRVLMTVGSCAASLLVLAWAMVHELAAFYLIWVGIGVTLAAVLYEPAFFVVATWFTRQRGRALTVLTFVAGFASVIYIPLSGWLVHWQGWRGALVILAIILGAGTIPLHALVLRRRPEDLGLAPDGAPRPAADHLPERTIQDGISMQAALRDAAFWWLSTAFFLSQLATAAVAVHLVPYLTDVGYDAGFAAIAAGLIGTMALPGRLIFTPLGDRLPRHQVTACLFFLQTVALLVLLQVRHVFGVYAFVVLFGIGFGAMTPARAALVADLFGPAHYGKINGVLALFVTGSRAFAPVTAGIVYDFAGGYELVFWGLGAASALATVAVLLVRRQR
ncbi:MAG TPA: MFS transporter [Candidatus Tectomicrobia bacterium]|nr:MFS transporter [Candidatus Tectomicrobia bacterium]